MIFAKLFQYPTGQLLVTFDPDYDSDEYVVNSRSDTEDLSVNEKRKFKTHERALKEFEAIDGVAEQIFNGMQQMMAQ